LRCSFGILARYYWKERLLRLLLFCMSWTAAFVTKYYSRPSCFVSKWTDFGVILGSSLYCKRIAKKGEKGRFYGPPSCYLTRRVRKRLKKESDFLKHFFLLTKLLGMIHTYESFFGTCFCCAHQGDRISALWLFSPPKQYYPFLSERSSLGVNVSA